MARKTTITGEGIRDETVESADIASGSIKAGEMSEQAIRGQALITSTNIKDDKLLIWDATDTALKEIALENLFGEISAVGTDANFFVSGAIGSQGQPSTNGTAVFGGDLLVSGSVRSVGNLFVEHSAGMYTDKIRRYSDSDNTTKILLNDELIKIYAGNSTKNILAIGQNAGADTNFYVSGSIGSMWEGPGTAASTRGTAVFSGDLLVSGALDVCGHGLVVDAALGKVGISTVTPRRNLDILDIAAPQLRITHTDNSKYVDIQATEAGDLTITGSNANAHLRFISPGNSSIIVQSDAGDGDAQVGFSVDAGSSIAFSVGVDDGDSDKFKIGTSTVDTNTRLTIDSGGNIGIGNISPTTRLDLHHDPSGLAGDTGGGEAVTFGAEDQTDTLAAGKLMYLNSSGVWKYTDADAVATSGGVLLAIALGTAVADGLLIRGFFDAVTIQGSFVKGGVCYVSEEPGVIDFTAPSAPGDVVRVVGYGTDTANVIYFNPSSTWIELIG